MRHEYFVTRPVTGWHGGLPVLRIPDLRIYVRAEGPGILCGGWEADGMSLDPRQVAVGQPLAVRPDWDVLSGFARDFAAFVPAVAETGVREREQAERRYEDYYSLPGATFPVRGES